MSALFARKAFLPQGFEDGTRLDIDATGHIAGIETGAKPQRNDILADILIPGMPNLHCHSFQRAMAGLAEYKSGSSNTFWTWRSLMYELASKVTPEDLAAIAAQLYMELLKSGYTSVAEFHYLHGMAAGKAPLNKEMSLAILDAANETGIGLTHLPVLYEGSGFGRGDPLPEQASFSHSSEAFIDLVERLETRTKIDPNMEIGTAFHSLRAVTPASLAKVSGWADAAMPGRPIHIHIAEQEQEVRDCLAHHGARPVEWLLDNADVDGNWCLVHATHMTADETEAAAKSGAIAGLCPSTEANLGDGLFDLSAWLENGGSLGLGSDSNVSTSPVEEARLLEYASRLNQQRRLIATSPEHPGTGAFLWAAATKGGARALGRKTGSIEIGNKADFLNLDAGHPSLCAATGEDILNALVFGPSQGAIRDVYVGGRPVVKDGRHSQEEQISARYRKCVKSLLESQ